MIAAEIKISCGIGDAITYLARIPEFRKKEDVDILNLWIAGGWQNTPSLIREILEPSMYNPEGQPLINQINYHSMISDKRFDWIPDTAPLNYELTLPFKIPTFDTDSIELPYNNHKICVIQPITTSGSFEGFNSGRYLDSLDWMSICDKMHELGYKVIQIGGFNEDSYVDSANIDINLSGVTTLRESVWILKKCDFFIGTNSWCWEVAAYAGIKTICLYYTNTHWIKLHTLNDKGPSHGMKNLRIETDKNISTIIKYIEDLENERLLV